VRVLLGDVKTPASESGRYNGTNTLVAAATAAAAASATSRERRGFR
jgi:hypothetical protein